MSRNTLTLSGSLAEKKNLEQKNAELAEAFREKSRAQQRLQSLYQKLKGRVNAVAVEDAATHDVESVIQAVAAGQRTNSQGKNGPQRPVPAQIRGQGSPTMFQHARQGSGGSAGSGGRPAYVWDGQGRGVSLDDARYACADLGQSMSTSAHQCSASVFRLPTMAVDTSTVSKASSRMEVEV